MLLGGLSLNLGELKAYAHYRQLPTSPCVYVTFLNAAPGAQRCGRVAELRGAEAFAEVDWMKGMDYFGVNRDLRQIQPLREGKDRFFYIITVGASKWETHQRFLKVLEGIDLVDEAGRSLIDKNFDFDNFYLVEAVEEGKTK